MEPVASANATTILDQPQLLIGQSEKSLSTGQARGTLPSQPGIFFPSAGWIKTLDLMVGTIVAG
jgi:hypothetical protein